jgi:hypothetical protein
LIFVLILFILFLFAKSFVKKNYICNYDFFYLGTLVAYYIVPIIFLFLIGGPDNTPLSRIKNNWFDSILDEYWWKGLLVIVFAYLAGKKLKLVPVLVYRISVIPRAWVFISLFVCVGQSFQIFESEVHGDSFALIAKLPLIVRQLLKAINFIVLPMWILLVIHTMNKSSSLWYFIIIFLIFINFTPYGSRGATVSQLLVLSMVYSLKNGMPNRIRFSLITFLGFLTFLFLGIFRSEEMGDVNLVIELLRTGVLPIYLGELDQIFANAVEIFNLQNRNLAIIPLEVRMTEKLSLIPSQLLPFEKLTYSEWYLNTFYPSYKELGGGWAFGTMAFIGTFNNYIIPFLYLIEMWLLIYIIFNKALVFFPVWFRYPLQIFIFNNLLLIHRTSPLVPLWSTLQALIFLFFLFVFINFILNKNNSYKVTN